MLHASRTFECFQWNLVCLAVIYEFWASLVSSQPSKFLILMLFDIYIYIYAYIIYTYTHYVNIHIYIYICIRHVYIYCNYSSPDIPGASASAPRSRRPCPEASEARPVEWVFESSLVLNELVGCKFVFETIINTYIYIYIHICICVCVVMLNSQTFRRLSTCWEPCCQHLHTYPYMLNISVCIYIYICIYIVSLTTGIGGHKCMCIYIYI